MDRAKVVVVGGGPAGVATAQALYNTADVTLIDPAGYLEIHWPCMRCMVDPEVALKLGTLVEYKSISKLGKVVKGLVTDISEKEVTLEGGEKIGFDYVVLCMGSSYPERVMMKQRADGVEERMKQFSEMSEKVKEAKSVVVVGGGVVGVEMAAEIRAYFPKMDTTLVTNGSSLIADRKPSTGAKCLAWLESNDVKVIFNNKVEDGGEGTIKLSSTGEDIQADVVLWCISPKCNTQFFQKAFPKSVNEQGQIMVDQYLCVKGMENMFSVGDCNDVPETKLGYLAMEQGKLVGKSIAKLIEQGKEKSKLKAYSPGGPVDMMIVTLGPNAGVVSSGSYAFGGWFPRKVKAGGLLVWKTRKDIGLGSPSYSSSSN